MDLENDNYNNSSDTEYITVKEEVCSDSELEVDVYEEVGVKEKITEKEIEDNKISTESTPNFRRNDLFQQPFVLKYLQDYVQSREQITQNSLELSEEHECFVDPRSVCRLCTKTDQNIFMRLFFINHTLTPIAEKLVYLTGAEYVEEDLLPQQICLECCELVKSSYSAVTQFIESHQILSDIVAEIKKKTHVFHKPNTTISMYMKVYDKDYEFHQKRRSTAQEKSNNARKKETVVSEKKRASLNLGVKCYLCKENFLPGALKEHMVVEHDCNVEYKCTSCDNVFPTLLELSAHQCSESCNDNIEHEDGEDGKNRNESDDEISGTSEHEFTPDMMIKTNKKRKLQLIDKHCEEMVKIGTTDCRSCKYCGRIFRLKFSDDLIKAHILTHLYSSEEKQFDIDPNNLDLVDHITWTPCYVCSFCSMTKQTPTALRSHLHQFCSTFAKKFNLKIRDRRRYGKTRGKLRFCKTCADDKPYRRKDFINHMKENHPEVVYFCRFCPKFFLSRSEIDYHNRMRHINQKVPDIKDENVEIKKETLLCEFCSRECKTQRGYQAHVLKAHLSSNSNKKILKRLSKKNNRENSTYLECPICKCKKAFKDGEAGLEFHIMKHNAPNGKIICCNREYINFVKYKIHVKSHSRTWSCKICHVKCGSSVLLQDHVASNHTQCTECSHVSRNITEYRKHMQQVHGQNSLCSECNIMFSTQKEYMVHQRQFHWEKLNAEQIEKSDLLEPILCCGKKFWKKANLKSHTAKHQDTVCKTCGDVLKSKLALLGHNATHHRQGVECSYCNKSFCNNDSLKYHMLKHTQGRQFKCACGLSFYTEADMNKHQRTRKRPCLGSMVGDNATVVIVKVDDENMEWTDETYRS